MGEKIDFTDILQPRNTHFGIIKFMTRPWNPKKTMKLEREYFPRDIKHLVSKSVYLDSVLDAVCIKNFFLLYSQLVVNY